MSLVLLQVSVLDDLVHHSVQVQFDHIHWLVVMASFIWDLVLASLALLVLINFGILG